MKKILLILFSLMFITNVQALTICEESDNHKKWNNLTDEEKQKYIEPEYCKKENKKRNSYGLRSTIGSYYSSVDLGLVTSPKNQGSTNACWAFSSVSLLETGALLNNYPALDLSERHINMLSTRDAYLNGEVNEFGYNRDINDGGNFTYVASYLFRGSGPVLESSMPYVKPWYLNYAKVEKSSMPSYSPILTIDEFLYDYADEGCSTNRLDKIKQYIKTYGSIGATINSTDGISTERDYYYINTTNEYTDHAITIVGYDDNISKDNFIGATRNGAFIVKNSWGTDFADNGYYYISYDDILICDNVAIFKNVKENTYDKVYYSSDVISNVTTYSSNVTYLSSKMHVEEESYLDKISIQVEDNTPYEVYLSLNNNLTDSSSWTLVGSGTSELYGVISINFNKILVSNDFTVIVKYKKSGFTVPLMCRGNRSTERHYYMNISTNTNYYSEDGSTWEDLGSFIDENYNGCEPIIYAYTYKKDKVSGTIDEININKTNDKVYIKSDDYFIIDFKTSNITYKEMINIKVKKDNQVINQNFDIITDDISDNYFYIKLKDDTKSGTYEVTLNYNNSSKSVSFIIYDKITSNVFNINNSYIKILPLKNVTINKDYVINNIIHEGNMDIKRNNLSLKDENILTKDIVSTDDAEYTIILIGDANMDGNITPLDYIRIKNHILGKKVMTDDINLIGADANEDGKITPLDYIRIKNRILKGEV